VTPNPGMTEITEMPIAATLATPGFSFTFR
jgi:hypothetical protein